MDQLDLKPSGGHPRPSSEVVAEATLPEPEAKPTHPHRKIVFFRNTNSKKIIPLLTSLVLVIGLATGAYLVQQNQDVRKEAANQQTFPDNDLLITLRDQYNAAIASQAGTGDSPESGELEESGLNRTLTTTPEPTNVSSPDQILATMTQVAQERMNTLLQEIESDPQLFLNHASLWSQKDTFPDSIKPLIETNATLEGNFMFGLEDNFEAETSRQIQWITGPNYEVTNLHSPTNPDVNFRQLTQSALA